MQETEREERQRRRVGDRESKGDREERDKCREGERREDRLR